MTRPAGSGSTPEHRICERTGKVKCTSEASAKNMARNNANRIRVYRCGDHWHVGSAEGNDKKQRPLGPAWKRYHQRPKQRLRGAPRDDLDLE